MNTREYCCYTRPYSEIEGLQLAHTLLYSASAQPEGIVLELRVQQGGGNYTSRVVCPDGSFARVMRPDAVLMRERNRPRAVAGCVG